MQSLATAFMISQGSDLPPLHTLSKLECASIFILYLEGRCSIPFIILQVLSCIFSNSTHSGKVEVRTVILKQIFVQVHWNFV